MVAAHAAEFSGSFDYKLESYIFIVRAEDGHQVTKVTQITHGTTSEVADYAGVSSSGMYFDPYGMVYMAHNF